MLGCCVGQFRRGGARQEISQFRFSTEHAVYPPRVQRELLLELTRRCNRTVLAQIRGPGVDLIQRQAPLRLFYASAANAGKDEFAPEFVGGREFFVSESRKCGLTSVNAPISTVVKPTSRL